MPSETERKRRFMGIAKAMKEGEMPASYSPMAAKAAHGMTMQQLRDYAKKKSSWKSKLINAAQRLRTAKNKNIKPARVVTR